MRADVTSAQNYRRPVLERKVGEEERQTRGPPFGFAQCRRHTHPDLRHCPYRRPTSRTTVTVLQERTQSSCSSNYAFRRAIACVFGRTTRIARNSHNDGSAQKTCAPKSFGFVPMREIRSVLSETRSANHARVVRFAKLQGSAYEGIGAIISPVSDLLCASMTPRAH